MPRVKSCMKITIVLLSFALCIIHLNKDKRIQKRLNNVYIPDLKFYTSETKNYTHDVNSTEVSVSSLDAFNLWDTKSLDDLLPDKYIRITGTKRTNAVYLTIGIPSIKRPSGAAINYLSDTLKSLIQNCAPEDQERVLILIFLADFDREYTASIRTQLETLYEPYLKSGFVQVMEVDPITYPELKELKQNFKDEKTRVTWRSKQCIDFAYMFYYARNLSQYYLQLEDDVITTPNYVANIQAFINSQKKPWISLQFSVLGFIGKLFKSSDLAQFARFLKLFYTEMPVDWLYPIFAKLLSYPDMPIRKPTLFQHMGKVSSLNLSAKQKLNLLKDKFFQKQTNEASKTYGTANNPPATFYTSLQTYSSNNPNDAYIQDNKKFFWGKEPNINDTFTMIFQQAQRLKTVGIETGHPDKGNDFIRAADLLVGTAVENKERKEDLCEGKYKSIGSLSGGSVVVKDLEKTLPTPVDCIKILVTASQIEWVIINTVSVWTV